MFNKKEARKWAIFFNHKYLVSYIWGQTHLENECISYVSTELFLQTIHNKKLALKNRFDSNDNFSEYTIDLLKGLKKGWDEINDYLKFEDKTKLSLNELIHLNNTLSNFEPSKPASGIRSLPVKISGTKYIPEPVLIPSKVEEELELIWNNNQISELDKSIELFLYISKTQVFFDGNKRTALLTSSYNLINNGIASGIFIDPEKKKDFITNLISYYEDESNKSLIVNFLKIECIEYVEQFKQTDEYKMIFNNELSQINS